VHVYHKNASNAFLPKFALTPHHCKPTSQAWLLTNDYCIRHGGRHHVCLGFLEGAARPVSRASVRVCLAIAHLSFRLSLLELSFLILQVLIHKDSTTTEDITCTCNAAIITWLVPANLRICGLQKSQDFVFLRFLTRQGASINVKWYMMHISNFHTARDSNVASLTSVSLFATYWS
jgi:hypothetical protein